MQDGLGVSGLIKFRALKTRLKFPYICSAEGQMESGLP